MPTAAIMSPRSLVKLGGLVDTLNQPIEVPKMLVPVKLIGTSQIRNALTVGVSTDCSEIYVGDFSKMALAQRENFSMMTAPELYATTGQIASFCHARADVIVTYPSAFTQREPAERDRVRTAAARGRLHARRGAAAV